VSTETVLENRPRNGCPWCGAALKVGFGDFLPTKGRGGPVRYTCAKCRGTARLASSSQVLAVLGFVVGLAGGAIAAARFAADSEQSMVIVLVLAVAGALLLSFIAGYTFLRFDPEAEPPGVVARRERDKRAKQRKERRK
jgi:hypothetical protein